MKKLEIPITCPNCGRVFPQRVEEIRPGAQTKCPCCQAVINFKGDDGRIVQKMFDDLPRKIEIKVELK